MIKFYKTTSKSNYLMLLPFLIFISLYLSSCSNQTGASDFPDCFVGTYININEEGSGTKRIWNLSNDGTIAGQSSAQEDFNFTGQLGSWTRTGNREAKIVLFDFSFNQEGVGAIIARVDVIMTFNGENCEEVEGSFELRFFDDNEDPFNITSDDGEVIEEAFTGSKLLL
jgi:hypothetical protein